MFQIAVQQCDIGINGVDIDSTGINLLDSNNYYTIQ